MEIVESWAKFDDPQELKTAIQLFNFLANNLAQEDLDQEDLDQEDLDQSDLD